MINKERYSFIFLAILAMLDQLIASLFGVDFTYSSLSLVSHLCFCAVSYTHLTLPTKA